MCVAAQGKLYCRVSIDMLQPKAAAVLEFAMNREINLLQNSHLLVRERHQEDGLS
jgi:hypothetical protein